MCMTKPKAPAPVVLPAPVAPIEIPKQVAKVAPPPPPEKTATYLGMAPGAAKVTAASSGGSSRFSSLRIRPGKTYMGLNVPNA